MEWFIWVSQWRFQGRGPEGPASYLNFRPYWGPKGRKRFLFQGLDDRASPLSEGLVPPLSFYSSSSSVSRCIENRARAPTLFLDHTKPRRAEKDFYLRVWMTGPPPYLKVWFRHCLFTRARDRSVSRCMENNCFCHFKCAYIKYTDKWWRSRKRWKLPAESTMNHPFIPGGSHEKRYGDGCRDIISNSAKIKGNQSRCGASFIKVYLLSLKVKEESFRRAWGRSENSILFHNVFVV